MYDQAYYFGKFYQLTNIGITVFRDDRMIHPEHIEEFYPVRDHDGLRNKLVELADTRDVPVFLQDEHEVIFACMKRDKDYICMGPIALNHMNRLELHRFYFDYGMRKGIEQDLPVLSFGRVLAAIELLAAGIYNRDFTDEELLKGNGIQSAGREQTQEDKLRFQTRMEQEEQYHHTYMEEKDLLDCVREGRVEDALRCNAIIDSEAGIMSMNAMDQWRKLVTVAIALTTRAAIDGGVSPTDAYLTSDYYNQQTDSCRTPADLIAVRNRAVRDLTEQVHRRLMKKSSSSYVEQCCDYINKNYREKIYLEEIAEKLGISPSYLSRLFAREKGMRMQDYIVQVRVERAANLLVYSDETIAGIGDYVNFPSQSYFGRVFRKYKNMTPKKYRELYKPREF